MNLQQFKDAFDAQGLPYRTEADGTIITDCPACESDGKGKDKAKIFADGGFTCFRFAGTGAAEHKREMLAAWNLESSAKPSAFLSETILGGQVTIEIERGERNKQRVTARNCTSVLHIDTFNLADNSARVKFIKGLSLTDADATTAARTLIDLADRFSRVADAVINDEEKEPVKTTFAVLTDGRLIEQVIHGFAVYDTATGTTTIERSVKDEDGTLYLPDDSELFLLDEIKLAELPEEYGSEAELDRAIENYIYKYVDVPSRDLALCAKFARLTYAQENLFEVPYLRGVGQSGNGKTRLCHTVGLICYRPLIVVNPSPASIFRIVHEYHPTLTIDEGNFTQSDDTAELIRILNAGWQRLGSKIPRTERHGDGGFTVKIYDVFGAKIISSLKAMDSQAFESRGIKIEMQVTSRKDIRFRLSREMLNDARRIRNMLTLWRLRTFNRDIEAALDRAEFELKQEAIMPRYVQVSIPLYAMLSDDSLKADFIDKLKDRNEKDGTAKQQTFDGQLVTAIHELLFDFNTKDEPVGFREDSSCLPPEDGKICELLPVKLIVQKLNEDKSTKDQTDERYTGKAISKLELNSGKIRRRDSNFYDKKAVIFDRTRLANLFRNFSLPVSPDFRCPQCPQTDNTNDRNNLTADIDAADIDAGNASCPQINSNTCSDLEDLRTLRTSKVPETDASDKSTQGNEDIFAEEAQPATTGLVALDTETEPFNKKLGITPRNAKMIGMSLSYDGTRADYETDKDAWAFLMPDADQNVILHNAKFDFGVLRRAGLPVPSKFEDTLIAAHLLDENSAHGLKPLAKKHLGIDDPVTFEEADKMRLLDPEVFAEYARNDARYTFRLWERFRKELDSQELRQVYEMEKQLLPVVMAMEERGMKINTDSLAAIEREVKTESARLKTEIFDLAGMEFDLSKPLSVGTILFDKLGLKCPKETAKGARSVDSESLKEIAHPLAAKILEHRKIDKLANTFVKVLPKFADENGRIHPEFKPLGAATGRFSCADPNVQQIPNKSELGKAVRRAFICEDGNKLIVADFSQMELRVLAHYSQDALLLEAYCGTEETDLHTVTAQKMFRTTDVSKDMRGIAKMINFGIAYGITDVGLFRRLTATGIETTPGDCKKYIADYFKTYKGVEKFLNKVKKAIRDRGYVKNFFGRRRRLEGTTAREIRQAQNFIIQATSADLVKRAMVTLSGKLPEGAQLISMVHDELIIESRAEIADVVLGIVTQVMQDTPEGFTVPMPVDAKVVGCWADAK